MLQYCMILCSRFSEELDYLDWHHGEDWPEISDMLNEKCAVVDLEVAVNIT